MAMMVSALAISAPWREAAKIVVVLTHVFIPGGLTPELTCERINKARGEARAIRTSFVKFSDR
jgi:hypothetical protein